MSGTRRVTQADLAKLAGVSQATVSHVLAAMSSGGRSRVSPALQKRVEDAIYLTGYVVNPIAQRLAGGKSRLIGVFSYEPVFTEGDGGFYLPFLVGIERAAEEGGWDLLLHTGAETRTGRRRLLSDGGVRSLGLADGCILLGRRYDERDLELLVAEQFPFAFIGARSSSSGPVPYVAPDYTTATRQVLGLLSARGHTNIAYVGDIDPLQVNSDRLIAYRDFIHAEGSATTLVIDSSSPVDLIVGQIMGVGATAVLTDNGGVAARLKEAVTGAGLSVPEDLSIAQLGDPVREDQTDWTGFTIPRLEMGYEALSLVAELIQGGSDTPQRILACSVSEGSTIAAPRVRDTHIDVAAGSKGAS